MKKRVFAALEISEEAKQKISTYIESLRKAFPHLRVGWVKPEKLHLTLKFLGDVDNWELSKLMTAVENTSRQIPSFTLQLADTGVFPKPEKAKVLWIDVKDKTGNLLNLNGVIEDECEKQDFRRESRNFAPHLTIARLRETENSRELIEKHLRKIFQPVVFEVSEIVIFQSILQPTGSVYNKIGSWKLQNQ